MLQTRFCQIFPENLAESPKILTKDILRRRTSHLSMYFRRNYQPNYSSVREHHTDTAALYRYWSSLRARNTIRRKPLHRYHRSNHNPGARYDPLLFFALGYMLAASDRDQATRSINGAPPESPPGGPGNESQKPFEIRYIRKTCFNGPLDTSILTSNYRPGQFLNR